MLSGCVEVSPKMAVSGLPDVWAAGDIVAFPLNTFRDQRVNIGHWGLAMYHGKVAALDATMLPPLGRYCTSEPRPSGGSSGVSSREARDAREPRFAAAACSCAVRVAAFSTFAGGAGDRGAAGACIAAHTCPHVHDL